ncbi:hypothetical protein PAXINDRAFT_20018 [Paxillus involutus ATCC 200175]|uniref:Uncharacterized protein n=1 Tax=Paxillus involutus ATCC 200175 TaxID=664439 RepID=A0A0C9SVS0_PAXIN|nr:hypothetical protein PAXINDRAFT_20018 [Paxillus involutus ATCC 200175]
MEGQEGDGCKGQATEGVLPPPHIVQGFTGGILGMNRLSPKIPSIASRAYRAASGPLVAYAYACSPIP